MTLEDGRERDTQINRGGNNELADIIGGFRKEKKNWKQNKNKTVGIGMKVFERARGGYMD